MERDSLLGLAERWPLELTSMTDASCVLGDAAWTAGQSLEEVAASTLSCGGR